MDPTRVDVNPRANAIRLLLAVGLARVPQRQLAIDDEVRGQASVGMRRVVVVAAIGCQQAAQLVSQSTPFCKGRK